MKATFPLNKANPIIQTRPAAAPERQICSEFSHGTKIRVRIRTGTKLKLKLSISATSSSSDYFYWQPMASSLSPLTKEEEDPQSETQSLAKYLNPAALDCAAALGEWLRARMPSADLARWGAQPGTKTLQNLWTELLQGEITLQDARPPKRTVNVACVSIRSEDMPGRVLIESHQFLTDGALRPRKRPLSEKLKAGETVPEACLRGIAEELGSILELEQRSCSDSGSGSGSISGSSFVASKVRLLLDSYVRQVEKRDSVSYPGLPSCYVLHSLDAVVSGLPTSDFVTDEDEDEHEHHEAGGGPLVNGGAVGVKKHFWTWVPEREVSK